MTGMPPAGWYPAPHANNESRYWDGQRWLEPPAAVAPQPVVPVPSAYAPQPYATPQATQTLDAPQTPPSRPQGLAIASAVLGAIAFLTGLLPWLGLILAIAAVGFGIFALVQKQSKPLAITGTAFGGVALIAGLIATVSFSTFVGSAGSSSRTTSDGATSQVTEAPAVSEASPQAESPAAAVPEPAPAAPAAPDGSAASPLPQPYVAKGLLGGEKYTLTGRIVDPNGSAQVEEWNMFNSDAPAGFKYVVVELTMTGIDPDGVEPSLAEWDLSLATSEGNKYDSEFVIFGDGMPSMSDGPTLYPGNSFTGYTAYIVPESAQAFLLHDNGNYISF